MPKTSHALPVHGPRRGCPTGAPHTAAPSCLRCTLCDVCRKRCATYTVSATETSDAHVVCAACLPGTSEYATIAPMVTS